MKARQPADAAGRVPVRPRPPSRMGLLRAHRLRPAEGRRVVAAAGGHAGAAHRHRALAWSRQIAAPTEIAVRPSGRFTEIVSVRFAPCRSAPSAAARPRLRLVRRPVPSVQPPSRPHLPAALQPDLPDICHRRRCVMGKSNSRVGSKASRRRSQSTVTRRRASAMRAWCGAFPRAVSGRRTPGTGSPIETAQKALW